MHHCYRSQSEADTYYYLSLSRASGRREQRRELELECEAERASGPIGTGFATGTGVADGQVTRRTGYGSLSALRVARTHAAGR